MAKSRKAKPPRSKLSAWLASLAEQARRDPVRFAIWATAAGLALLVAGFYLFGYIQQNLSGEAFFDFQYPYRLPFAESWKVFFLERIRSRLMHGVFISALYSLVGFNPPAIYLGIFLLIIATAAVIVFTLKDFIRSPWVASLLVIALTWLPLNITDLMSLKKAHHALAWFAFWLAAYLFQRWIAKKQIGWLLAATLAFLASILAYEATIALLPVAVFLSLPYLKDWKDLAAKIALVLWISFLAALVFLDLEKVKPYTGIESFYSSNLFDAGGLIQNLLALIPQWPAALWSGVLFGEAGLSPLALLLSRLIIIGLLALALFIIIWNAIRDPQRSRARSKWLSSPTFALTLAALWLAAATYLPFMAAGQPPDGDSLRGAAFGLILLTLAGSLWLAQLGKPRLGQTLLIGVCLFWITVGGFSYNQGIQRSAAEDAILKNFVISLKEQVPDVSGRTAFVFVNASLGRTGCIGALNMLYDTGGLHCIHLLDNDSQETYTRESGGLREDGGRLFADNLIILTFDEQGFVTVLPEISHTGYPLLPVTWQVDEPIRTNFDLIYSWPFTFGKNYAFYNYMLTH